MITIAAAQSLITSDIAANGAHIRALIEAASAKGARLLHFPEGALSGYIKTEIKHWDNVRWGVLEAELAEIKACCATHNIYAVIGSAHRAEGKVRPHNSLYVIGDTGAIITRYDKRRLSHTEINDWYVPGFDPVVFEVDGYKFGCMICIEMVFPDLFAAYERLGVDGILFASYGFGAVGDILMQAHAATNCVWLSASVPQNRVAEGAAGIVGPDGFWMTRCGSEAGLSIARLDRRAPEYDIALTKARPWRAEALIGNIYRRAGS